MRAGACPCVSWEPGSCGTGSGQWLLGDLCDTREVQGMHAHVCICAPSCTWVRTCVCVCTACAHTNLPAHMRFPCLEETVSLHWLSCCRLPVFVSYRTPCLDVTGFGLQAVSAEPRPPLEAGLQEGGPAALMPPSTHRALSQHRHMWVVPVLTCWIFHTSFGTPTSSCAHPITLFLPSQDFLHSLPTSQPSAWAFPNSGWPSPLGPHPPPLHLSSSWKWPQASVSDLPLQPSSPTRCHPDGQGPWACLTAAPGACPSRPCPGRLVTLDPAASFLKHHVQPLPKSAHLPL